MALQREQRKENGGVRTEARMRLQRQQRGDSIAGDFGSFAWLVIGLAASSSQGQSLSASHLSASHTQGMPLGLRPA